MLKPILLLLVLSSTMTYSQYKGGLELGGNLMNADFIIDESINTRNSWGIRLGYVAEYKFSKHFYVRSAALINQRGFQFGEERWALNVIDVPINIGYSVNLNTGDLAWFIDAGFDLEYGFRAFTKIDGELVTLDIGNGTEDIKTFSNGLNIGTGIQFSKRLKIRASYYHGFTNLLRTQGDEWKNRVLALSLNYFFKK